MTNQDAVTLCFQGLRPLLAEVCRIVMSAPISPDDRATLAAMVTAHMLGGAAAAHRAACDRPSGRTLPDVARDIADEVVGLLERDEVAS